MTITQIIGTQVCGTGTTRATRAEMEHRRATLLQIAEEAQPASVRHIYYRAVAAGLVEKKQTGYRKVQREILELRRSGEIPFSWITDDGRRAHWPLVRSSPRSALASLAYNYARDPWQGPEAPRVEIWCESESLAGVLMPLRDSYAVPIFPLKGQGSETFAWSAAQSYGPGERVVILYAGDYDPAGLQIGSQLEGKLNRYSDCDQIDFRRLAITDKQSTALQPLGTPAKQHHWIDYDGDRHEFIGTAIESEAVDPQVMRDLFASQIEQVAYDAYGYDVFARSKVIEVEEREQLQDLMGRWSE